MRTIFVGIMILFLLAACGGAAPAPQVTVISEMTVTLTPTATVTAAPTLTPTPTIAAEFDLKTVKGWELSGDSWKFVDNIGMEYTFADMAVAEQKPDGNGILVVGAYNIDVNTGDVVVETSAIPRPEQQIDSLRTFIVDMQSQSWRQQLNTALEAGYRDLKAENLFSVFNDLSFNDKYLGERTGVTNRPVSWSREIVEDGVVFVPELAEWDTDNDNSLLYRQPQMSPFRIYPGSGFMRLQVFDGSNQSMDGLLVPIAMQDTDGQTAVPVYGFVRREVLSESVSILGTSMTVMEALNSQFSYLLAPKSMPGTSKSDGHVDTVSRYEDLLLSDPQVREFMAQVNREFFLDHKGSGRFFALPDMSGTLFDFVVVRPMED